MPKKSAQTESLNNLMDINVVQQRKSGIFRNPVSLSF